MLITGLNDVDFETIVLPFVRGLSFDEEEGPAAAADRAPPPARRAMTRGMSLQAAQGQGNGQGLALLGAGSAQPPQAPPRRVHSKARGGASPDGDARAAASGADMGLASQPQVPLDSEVAGGGGEEQGAGAKLPRARSRPRGARLDRGKAGRHAEWGSLMDQLMAELPELRDASMEDGAEGGQEAGRQRPRRR